MSQVGTLIKGRYEIETEFVKCQFSTIYKAVDRKSNVQCLVKALNTSLPVRGDDQVRDCKEQFLMEGKVLAELDHLSLPRIIETITEGSMIFHVYEYFEGVTLELYMSNQPGQLDERPIKRVLTQLNDVVGYLHEQNPQVILAGVRPESIVVMPDGHLKLIEFGLMTVGGEFPGRTDFRKMGAPRYSSVEQLKGNKPSPLDDIYAMGAVVYLVATGTPPGVSRERQRTGGGEDLTDMNSQLSPALGELILGMMNPKENKRFSSTKAVYNSFIESFPTEAGSATFSMPSIMAAGGFGQMGGAVEQTVYPSFGGSQMEEMEAEKPQGLGFKADPNFQPVTVSADGEGDSGGLSFGNVVGSLFKGKADVQSAPDFTTPDSGFLSKYPLKNLKETKIEREVAEILPERICRSIRGICVDSNDKELTVVVIDPSQTYVYDHISFATKGALRPLVFRGDPMLIELAIEYIYEMPEGARDVTWFEFLEKKKYEQDSLEVKQDKQQIEMFAKEEIDGPVIEATNRIIKEAISIGASDIHIETFEQETLLRYRIDGVLHIMNSFPTESAKAIVKRLKILAQMDIAQERVTQGGRISVAVADKEFDLRVSIIPVPNGESVVMRLLNKGSFDFTLQDLGFDDFSFNRYSKLLTQPHGMILVSGPTGSGKSTTLYASLKEINRPDRKLLTIEDPIEYQMPGINQVQVNMAPREADKRVTFAKALREFLRQDPDVILVGEIRDPETAQIAVQAALTGHLLLSTIHTNDSVGIVTRLRDMGVAPYLVGSVLNGGIAQRLVRRICSECKMEVEATPADKAIFEANNLKIDKLYRGKGCPACHDYGYKGRVGLYEIFDVSPEIAEMISTSTNNAEIKRKAVEQGMQTLLDDALDKAEKGIITVDEVHRVTMG